MNRSHEMNAWQAFRTYVIVMLALTVVGVVILLTAGPREQTCRDWTDEFVHAIEVCETAGPDTHMSEDGYRDVFRDAVDGK